MSIVRHRYIPKSKPFGVGIATICRTQVSLPLLEGCTLIVSLVIILGVGGEVGSGLCERTKAV